VYTPKFETLFLVTIGQFAKITYR